MPDENTVMLAARAVDMRFGGVKALSGVEIELRRGITTGLIGPNGSGKSTLINVLTGVYRQTSGAVEFLGEDISRVSARSRALRGLGRTFQHPQVARSLTVRENIAVAAELRRHDDAMGVDDALVVFGCSEYADQLPPQVPYGVLKLMEIARAVVCGPRVLLLDEPAAGLNHDERRELVESLQRFRNTHDTAVCLIEHDVALVRALCSELVVLESGRVLGRGPTADVLQDPRVRAAYLGDDMAESNVEAGDPS